MLCKNTTIFDFHRILVIPQENDKRLKILDCVSMQRSVIEIDIGLSQFSDDLFPKNQTKVVYNCIFIFFKYLFVADVSTSHIPTLLSYSMQMYRRATVLPEFRTIGHGSFQRRKDYQSRMSRRLTDAFYGTTVNYKSNITSFYFCCLFRNRRFEPV